MDDLDPTRVWLLVTSRPSYRPVIETMAANPRVTPDERIDMLRTLVGIQSGSITSPYALSRSMGMTTSEAQAHPATAMYLAAMTYLGDQFEL